MVNNNIPVVWFNHKLKVYGVTFTRDQLWELYEAQGRLCALSGKYIGWARGACSASLDRIDGTKGYDLCNVQLVHKHVNRMKHTFSQAYFVELCRAITLNPVQPPYGCGH